MFIFTREFAIGKVVPSSNTPSFAPYVSPPNISANWNMCFDFWKIGIEARHTRPTISTAIFMIIAPFASLMGFL